MRLRQFCFEGYFHTVFWENKTGLSLPMPLPWGQLRPYSRLLWTELELKRAGLNSSLHFSLQEIRILERFRIWNLRFYLFFTLASQGIYPKRKERRREGLEEGYGAAGTQQDYPEKFHCNSTVKMQSHEHGNVANDRRSRRNFTFFFKTPLDRIPCFAVLHLWHNITHGRTYLLLRERPDQGHQKCHPI